MSKDIDWLIERHPKWKIVQTIAVVESHREVTGGVIRKHWRVEAMHWQLDVSFNEDQNRLRSGHAAENQAMLNKVALNLLKNEKSVKVGVKNKRLKAGWDNDYMLKVLSVGLLTV